MDRYNRNEAEDNGNSSQSLIGRRDVLKTGGAGLSSLALFGGMSTSGAAANSIKTPRLSTEDNWIVDPDGNKVVLRGVNVEDPYWAHHYDDKEITTKMEEATSGDWYSRVIRVPCETKRIEEAGGVESYAEKFLDPAVDKADELGVYLIIDYHQIDHWDDPEVHDLLTTFWDHVAPRYADREHVLYELFNEPVAPGGGSLDNWKLWRETAQPWVDSIREDAPETPIIIGSPRYCQLTHHADDAPFEGDDIIYAAHVYPYHFYNSVDMHDLSVTAKNVPLMMTEWGYENDENRAEHMIGTTSGYGQDIKEWFADNPSVGWTPWCYGRQYAPRMWDDDWNLRGGDDYMGEYVKNFLYEKRHDHRPGISSGASPRPAAPANLSSPETESTSVTLEWDPSSHPSSEASDEGKSKGNNGNWLDHYNVYVDSEKVQEVDSTSTTVSDLSSATTYDFYVTAVHRNGTESDWSNLLSVMTDFSGNLANTNSTSSAPAIDGVRDDPWNAAEALSLDNDLAGSPSDSNLDATAYTLYDPDNVYVLVEVTDDADAQDSAALYQDDSVEVYLDVGKDNETSYTDDDYQYQFRRDGSKLSETKHGATDGVEWATAETDDGYTVEIAFPHTTTGAAPSDCDMFGFDVHVNDDDDGGDRDAKIAWNATTDNSWQDPSAFGTLNFNFTGDGDDATAPTTPTNLSAPTKTDTTIDLSWDASDDDGGSGVAHYNVYVDGAKDHEIAADSTSTTVEGLTTDTSYDFHVTAVDGAGNESGSSNVVTELAGGDLVAPTAPANLTSPSNDDSSVDLSWDASTDEGGSGLDHYNVYVDGAKDHEVGAGTTSTTVTDLSAGAAYQFHVTAVDAVDNESDPSYVLTETTEGGGGDGPTAPENLSSPSHTDTTIDVEWDATNDEANMDYYTVWVDGEVVDWIAPGTTSATITDLASGTRYDIYVIVTVDGAASPPTDTITVTTD